MTKQVLVTGGAGFIGSHLVPKLVANGHRVRVMDNLSAQVHEALPSNLEWLKQEGIEFMRGDVVNPDDWSAALADVDAIVHLAAETGTGQSMYQIAKYNLVNTQATAYLFDALRKSASHRVSRIVLSSSRSVYGEGAYVDADNRRVFPAPRGSAELAAGCWEPVCPLTGTALSVVPTLESDTVSPASIYAATKYAQEDLVRIGAQSLGIGYAILRLQNVYGERQSLNNPYTGILSIFSTKIRRGLQLPLFEDGNESRDFVHVDDVTDAMVAALSRSESPDCVINVGSGVQTSVRNVAEELSMAFGRTPDIVVTGEYRLGDIRHNIADIGKLKSVLGITPQVSLSTGLRRFADWVLEQPLPEDLLDKANQELRTRNLMK